jgi:hypothetical protein
MAYLHLRTISNRKNDLYCLAEEEFRIVEESGR